MYKNKTHHHSLMDINNINLDDLFLGNIYIHDDALMDENRRPIVAGHIGNYVDPNTHQQFRVFMTRNRQIIPIPENARPQLRRERTSRQESARQRKNTRRAVRRALRLNPDNAFVNQQVYPSNVFLSQDPIQRMPRPAAPVHQQAPDPNSKRSLRKASSQQHAVRAANVANGQIYGGGKTKRRRRH